MRALYRFHTGAHALSSVAEVREQHNSLTPEQKDLLYVAHTTQNIKEVTSSGVTLYSPYISTTSNLEALIRTSFSPTTGGDRNIPQDVFARAESISAFVVPERMCKDPKLDLSIRESEVCYDSSYAPLISHRARVIENPLKRSIEVSALPLAISREDGAVHIARAAAIDRSMQELLATDPIVNPDFIARYTEIYRMREDLCATLAPMPRKPTIFKPLVHGEVVAVRMREAPTGNHASSGTAGAGVGSTRHEEDARDSGANAVTKSHFEGTFDLSV